MPVLAVPLLILGTRGLLCQVDVHYLNSNGTLDNLPELGVTLSNTTKGVLLINASKLVKAGNYIASFLQVFFRSRHRDIFIESPEMLPTIVNRDALV
eukprot:scaffold435_cov18-Tisochrysis_lutea.AAC.1